MNGRTSLVNNVDLSALQGNAAEIASKGGEALKNASAISESVSGILNLFKK
jgi:hypothetical protein